MKSESRGVGFLSLADPPANQLADQGLSKAVLLGTSSRKVPAPRQPQAFQARTLQNFSNTFI